MTSPKLIDQLVNNLAGDEVALGTCLRQLRVLAARLGSASLESWLQYEAEGYTGEAELPLYRVISAEIHGHFLVQSYSLIAQKAAAIPKSQIPDWLAEGYSKLHIRESIASIESLLQRHGSGVVLHLAMDQDICKLFHGKVFTNAACTSVWAVAQTGDYVNILSSVRSRALDFVLEIEKLDPNAGSVPGMSPDIPRDEVNEIIHQTIYNSGIANIAGTGDATLQAASLVVAGDVESLVKAVRQLGLADSDIIALRRAIKDDAAKPKSGGLGEGVTRWLRDTAGKTVSQVVAGTILHLILKYYGE